MYNRYKSIYTEFAHHLHNWPFISSLKYIIFYISGSEAMYADLGHFSQLSIKVINMLITLDSLFLGNLLN